MGMTRYNFENPWEKNIKNHKSVFLDAFLFCWGSSVDEKDIRYPTFIH